MSYYINKSGNLVISRKAFVRLDANCPFHADMRPCGDWCALFGEPTATSNMTTTLQLCHRTLSCPTALFKDQRDDSKE